MHIGLFAERFVGRYGADRVLVIIAEQLRQRGHQVTLMGVRFSEAVFEQFAQHTFQVPDFGYPQGEAKTLHWLGDVQYFLERRLPPFDACIVGGFPFITAIPYLRTRSRAVIFIDFGVVPTFGYPPSLTSVLTALKANRQANLRHATAIVPISSFIAQSQARPECRPVGNDSSEPEAEITPILLGADHLAKKLGYTEAEPHHSQGSTYTRDVLNILYKRGKKLILALGRWEPGCYKNSQAAFAVLRSLLEYDTDVNLLVTCPPDQFHVDTDLGNHAFSIGLPTDVEMAELTRRIDAGISVSLWEGFNLPVAELQYQEKEVFCFNLAAHPEVVVSPEQLCANTEEMAFKLYRALRDGGPPGWVRSGAVGPWREKFSWQRFENEFSQVVERAA